MKLKHLRQIEGQTLVIVALALFALIALVAVAIDGGNLMAERRKMQNAADAGALAGAHEICFGSPGQAEAVARDYAITNNGADQADVSIVDSLTVHVTATRTVETYFAGIIGFRTVNVAAEAAAMCSRAVSAGGIWPLSIRQEIYDQMECDETFYAFVSKKQDADVDDEYIDCTKCECDIKLSGNVVASHIGPGDRGWLRLFVPPAPYPNNCGTPNCGNSYVGCWVENGHPGPIRIGDCLPGKPGVGGLSKEVDRQKDKIYNLVLYDGPCSSSHELATCPGSGYHVSGFGCVEIFGWEGPIQFKPKPGYSNNDCPNGVQVVVVTKRCGEICRSLSGTGSGEVPGEDDVRAVGLVK